MNTTSSLAAKLYQTPLVSQGWTPRNTISLAAEPSDDLAEDSKPYQRQWRSFLGDAKDSVLDTVKNTNEFFHRHPFVNGVLGNTFAMFKVLKAFPKFIYPTISGATPAERAFILQTLDSLPLKDVNTIKSLSVVESIPHASGLAIPAQVTNVVKLARDQISISPEWFREVIIHEAGHTKDFDSAYFGWLHFNSQREPWGEGPHISDYAKTNHWEDYAETHAEYHMNPDKLKAETPEKYAVIAEQEKQGLLDRLIDQKPFRETGKWIGENLGQAPGMRTAIQVLYWAGGGLQLLKGMEEIRSGQEAHDPRRHMEGVLDVAAGTLFASKILAFSGLAVQGAHRAMNKAIDRKEITADDADAAVRMISNPAEKVIRFVGHKLGVTDSFSPFPENPDSPEPRRALATAIAVGGAVGGTTGGIVGPYFGILGGYAIGGPVGGALGMVAGALAGYAAGSSVGGRIGGVVARALGA
ncbi:MAG: hypothetical protein HYU64_12040 [Armatimonadetes bacterium]|nr:hypothetical protein [Armatimonadota bacterium]